MQHTVVISGAQSSTKQDEPWTVLRCRPPRETGRALRNNAIRYQVAGSRRFSADFVLRQNLQELDVTTTHDSRYQIHMEYDTLECC